MRIGVVIAIVVIGAVATLFVLTAPLTEGPKTGEFGSISLTLEYVLTEAARERGLGGRASVPEGYGMLFIFSHDDRYGFWMKDMLVPIDIYWLNDKGQVVSMVRDVATSTYPDVFYPSEPARYVLETVAGFGARHQIATGTSLLLQSWPTVLN
jgi:uncharacterized membrane protein (UPF0127 family)